MQCIVVYDSRHGTYHAACCRQSNTVGFATFEFKLNL